MIIEKIIRKRKLHPLLVEPISIVYFLSIGLLCLVVYGGIYSHMWLLMLTVYVIAVPLNALHMFHEKYPDTTPLMLWKEMREDSLDIRDIRITGVRYTYTYASVGANSYSNLLYKEPFLRLGLLAVESLEPRLDNRKEYPLSNETSKPLHFFLEKRSTWCYIIPKYSKYRKEWKKWLAHEDAEKNRYKYECNYTEEMYYIYFITLEKREAFNELFRLLVPTEIRIILYEKSRVFKEIHPIPGREYPPEALECMEKINAMYP